MVGAKIVLLYHFDIPTREGETHGTLEKGVKRNGRNSTLFDISRFKIEGKGSRTFSADDPVRPIYEISRPIDH